MDQPPSFQVDRGLDRGHEQDIAIYPPPSPLRYSRMLDVTRLVTLTYMSNS